MSAFVIVQGTVTDAQQYERYKAVAGPSVVDAGGSYLVRGGATVSLEGGEVPQRTVILRFDNTEAAMAWYESERYRAAKELRAGAAEMRLYVVEGS